MRFLSTRRRHPLAGLVVVLFALVVVGGLYAAFRPASADESTTDTQLISQGRKLFVVSCSTCHGSNGQGVLQKGGGEFGPPLIGVGAAAVDFQVGTGRMPLALPGTQAEARTPVFTPDEVRALAAYVASLGPGPAIPSKDMYDASNATPEQIAKGGEYFRTNCTACHNFAAQGGALPHGRHAPALGGVPAKDIYEALITGPQQMPKFSDGVLRPQEKRDIIAYIHSVTQTPGYGGARLAFLGPVTEGLWGWVIGVGALILATVWIGNQGVRARRRRR